MHVAKGSTPAGSVSHWKGNDTPIEAVMKDADNALYKAKHNGRNRTECINAQWSNDDDDASHHQRFRGNRFANALSNLEYTWNSEFKDCLLLVEYNSLVQKPQETLNKIYDFIGLPVYNHRYENIVWNTIIQKVVNNRSKGVAFPYSPKPSPEKMITVIKDCIK